MPAERKPKKWFYSREGTLALNVVKQHPDCLMELDKLLLREERGNTKKETNPSLQNVKKQFPVLDFDQIARLHKKGDWIPSSVDLVMVVIQKTQNQSKIQLVELKLKVERWNQGKINEVLQKVEDSLRILEIYDSVEQVRKQTLIVYSNQMSQENISILNRLALANSKLKFYSQSSFKKEYFDS